MRQAGVSRRTGMSDTSDEAQAVLDDVNRRLPIERKWELLGQAQRRMRLLAEARRRSRGAENMPMNQPGDDMQVLREVIGALHQLGISHALGGSMASSLYGEPRFTQDADLTVEPFAGREQALADLFNENYYASVPAMRQANQRRASFNIINTAVGFKCDLFVRKERPFEISAMSRRVEMQLPDRPEQPLYVLTAEDIILFKLEWYRLGGETSERQWLDARNVIKAQADSLDRAYLSRWATDLGIDDLLRELLSGAGLH